MADPDVPGLVAAGSSSRHWTGFERIVWHSIHLIFVGALVLTFVVVFALLCRWYLNQERRRRRGSGPLLLSPTGDPFLIVGSP